jgi:Arc/MetJ-type ribon-helix-helix transcriptional regulator
MARGSSYAGQTSGRHRQWLVDSALSSRICGTYNLGIAEDLPVEAGNLENRPMHVQLNPELEKFVDDQVREGNFRSREDVVEAGLARLMLDPEPDELDARDIAELTESLGQMRRGEVVAWKDLSARLRRKYLGE